MKQEIPPHPPALSLQGKLDRIAHDRDVLSLLRMLATQGLCDGDRVRHRSEPLEGYVTVTRAETLPRVVVVVADGSQHPYSPNQWRPA